MTRPLLGSRLPHSALSAQSRRKLLKAGGLVLLLGKTELLWGASIVAVRVWPAAEYTRVTIESDVALKTEQTLIDNPPRLAVDIQGLTLNPTLRDLVSQVRPDDPFIQGVRVGQYNPETVRLVLDLRQSVKPQVFTLPPVLTGQARFQHRLVLDLYPTQDLDPLHGLIASLDKPTAAASRTTPAPADIRSEAKSQAKVNSSEVKEDALSEWLANNPNARTPSNPPSGPQAPLQSPAQIPAPGSAQGSAQLGTKPTSPDKGNEPSRPARSVPQRFAIVALDPGHGGEDPGAIGPRGTQEKDVVLQIARKLKARLEDTTLSLRDGDLALRAYLTRDADFFVPLNERVRKARRVKADLFISIHADAFMTPKARGASVFALSHGAASSATARWMAEQENRSDDVGGISIQSRDQTVKQALLDMSTTAQINDSVELGGHMLRQMRKVGSLHKPQVEQAGFAVLKAPDIPSVLVETAFISNPEEERLLTTDSHQDALVNALVQGILQYFLRNPPRPKLRQA
ncbi:MAG: hypothetical protein RL307_1368 [Pseudomonadota bacterium]